MEKAPGSNPGGSIFVDNKLSFQFFVCKVREGKWVIFVVGLAGVGLNFWADKQRQTFRELNGKCMVWGKAPVFVKAAYSMTDASTGKVVRKSSLLLASGWWGIARHLQYAFELTAVS